MTRNDWERFFKEHRASGKSAAAFCRERGVSDSAYQYWRVKFKNESVSGGGGGSFVRVGVESEKAIEMELSSGVKLRVPADTDMETLIGILGAAHAVNK